MIRTAISGFKNIKQFHSACEVPALSEPVDILERRKSKEAMLGLVYLNAGLEVSKDTGGRSSHKVLAAILSNVHFRDQIGSPVMPKKLSFADAFASCTKICSRDVLLYIENLVPKKERDKFVRIRCRAISEGHPKNLIMELVNSFSPQKIEHLLETLAPKLGFEKPVNFSWSRYFDSWSVRPRDKAMLELLFNEPLGYKYLKYPQDRLLFLAAFGCKVPSEPWYFASDSLKRDPTFMPDVIKIAGRTLKYANSTLKNNPAIVLAGVRQAGCALADASDALKNNPAIVLEAVKQAGFALRDASDALKNNPTIVLAAVQQCGWALQYASDALKNNPAIVLAAVDTEYSALQYASGALKNDPTIVLAAVKRWSESLPRTGGAVQNDPALVVATVKQDVLQHADAALRNDPAFIQTAVRVMVPGAKISRDYYHPPLLRQQQRPYRSDPILSTSIR